MNPLQTVLSRLMRSLKKCCISNVQYDTDDDTCICVDDELTPASYAKQEQDMVIGCATEEFVEMFDLEGLMVDDLPLSRLKYYHWLDSSEACAYAQLTFIIF